MPRRIRSLCTAGTLVAAAVLLPVTTAAPAHATAKQCTGQLRSFGYVIGPKVKKGCRDVARSHNVNYCLGYMTHIGVRAKHADIGCKLGAK